MTDEIELRKRATREVVILEMRALQVQQYNDARFSSITCCKKKNKQMNKTHPVVGLHVVLRIKKHYGYTSERNSHCRSPFTLGHHLPMVGAYSEA